MATVAYFPHANPKANELAVAVLQGADQLEMCWGAISSGMLLAGCSLLDSQERAKEAWQFLAQLKKESPKAFKAAAAPLRLSVLQLGSVEVDWGMVQTEHDVLLGLDKEKLPGSLSVAHLCHPTEALYLAHDPKLFSEFAQKSLKRILDDFNAEAWLVYIAWFNEDAEQALVSFAAEASEEYQLQARLEDLRHEVHSTLQRSVKAEIYQASVARNQALAKGDRGLLLALEKSLIVSREQLKKQLLIQQRLLLDIADGISKIENTHPELTPLKMKAQLLWRLTQHYQEPASPHSWGRQLLLVQLLEECLGVVPLITSQAYPARVALTIAIRLAFHQLGKLYLPAQRLAFCDHFDAINIVDQERHQRLVAAVVANLKLFSSAVDVSCGQEETSFGINQALLPFLPVKTASQGALFLHSAADGKIALTPHGSAFFQRLGIL